MIGSPSLKLVASPELDEIYHPSPPPPSSAPGQGPPLLLTADRVPELVKAFSLNEEEEKELIRAVGQSEQRAKQTRERDHHDEVAKGKAAQDPVVQAVRDQVDRKS